MPCTFAGLLALAVVQGEGSGGGDASKQMLFERYGLYGDICEPQSLIVGAAASTATECASRCWRNEECQYFAFFDRSRQSRPEIMTTPGHTWGSRCHRGLKKA